MTTRMEDPTRMAAQPDAFQGTIVAARRRRAMPDRSLPQRGA